MTRFQGRADDVITAREVDHCHPGNELCPPPVTLVSGPSGDGSKTLPGNLHLEMQSVPQFMKIVHVVYSLEMGGAESLVAQLCRLQRANGHTVTIAAYSVLGTLGETLRGEGFHIDVLGTAPVPRTMLRYFQIFRRQRPDVVHCHNPAPTLQAAVGARLAGASSVISTRHSLVAPPFETVAEIKYNLISWFCNWVVGICDATCDNLRQTPLARKKHIVRVYNGADRLIVVSPENVPRSPASRSSLSDALRR